MYGIDERTSGAAREVVHGADILVAVYREIYESSSSALGKFLFFSRLEKPSG